MGAALLSGLLLTLLNCTAYLEPVLSTGALKFRDCSMVSVWRWSYPWFDWTYSQYLLALLELTFVLTLAACGFTVVLSRFSSSYAAMLLKAIPLIVVLCWGGALNNSGSRTVFQPAGPAYWTAAAARVDWVKHILTHTGKQADRNNGEKSTADLILLEQIGWKALKRERQKSPSQLVRMRSAV